MLQVIIEGKRRTDISPPYHLSKAEIIVEKCIVSVLHRIIAFRKTQQFLQVLVICKGFQQKVVAGHKMKIDLFFPVIQGTLTDLVTRIIGRHHIPEPVIQRCGCGKITVITDLLFPEDIPHIAVNFELVQPAVQ